MARRWRKEPALTGLSRIVASPQGSTLWDGELDLASTNYCAGEWETPHGWYWVAFTNKELGIVRVNTCETTLGSEQEAKDAAKAYIMECLKQNAKKK
jgi:hypothetical protein